MSASSLRRTEILLLISLLVTSSFTADISFGSSIDDCEAFSSMFSNTCATHPLINDLDFSKLTSVEESCAFPGMCPNGKTTTVCNWKRILCVSCYSVGGDTMLRVQANGLPDHCYYAPYNPPKAQYIDFTVLFNPDVPRALGGDFKLTTTIANQLDLDLALCDSMWSKTSRLPSYVDFSITDNSTNTDRIVGVALNGVFLFGGTSELGYDAFYPASFGEGSSSPSGIDPDLCLGSSAYSTAYHYYMFSPCILESKIKYLASACSTNQKCNTDKPAYITSFLGGGAKAEVPIGIAKDGHLIFGPFNAKGKLWQPCDVDVCNGRMMGIYYGYVSTMFHPYFVGCWGPGNYPINMEVSCSSNARKCSSSTVARHVVTYLIVILGTILSQFL